MLKRICYFLIGGVTVIQNQIFFPNDLPLSVVWGGFLLQPTDFVSMALLFLIGLFLFSQSLRFILRRCFHAFLGKSKFSGKDGIEVVIVAGMIVGLFQFGFWYPLLQLTASLIYSIFFLGLRVERRRVDQVSREE